MTQSKTARVGQSPFGVLYFCDDNPLYRKMLHMSIASLKRYHPDWPITVIDCPSFPVSLLRKLYRQVSFWKTKARYDRAGQDSRVIAAKAAAWKGSPYKLTLFMDVDTIVMRPLDAFRLRAEKVDVLYTSLNWKKYSAVATWQPATFPYLMSGIVFFNQHFISIYDTYVKRLASVVESLPTGDQYIFSLACAMEREHLAIDEAPLLQIDVLNLKNATGADSIPIVGECVDLEWEGLERFHVFHYNEYKPQYMERIQTMWGLTGEGVSW